MSTLLYPLYGVMIAVEYAVAWKSNPILLPASIPTILSGKPVVNNDLGTPATVLKSIPIKYIVSGTPNAL